MLTRISDRVWAAAMLMIKHLRRGRHVLRRRSGPMHYSKARQPLPRC